jgi:hypothetical protein
LEDVELLRRDPEEVAGTAGHDPLTPEQLAEPVNRHLERVRRRLRRSLAPEPVDQPLSRDGLVRVEKEERKQGTLPGPAQGKRPSPLHRFERAEDPELELSALLAHAARSTRKGAVSES